MINATHSNPVDLLITNDGFFPDFNMKDFQEVMRVKADLAPNLIYRGLVRAAFYINGVLEDFKTENVAAGNNTLEAVPQKSLGSGEDAKKELMLHYESAVFNYALGELHPELISLFRRKEASDYMDTIRENRQDYYNDSRQAVERILGKVKSNSNNGLFSGVIGGET